MGAKKKAQRNQKIFRERIEIESAHRENRGVLAGMNRRFGSAGRSCFSGDHCRVGRETEIFGDFRQPRRPEIVRHLAKVAPRLEVVVVPNPDPTHQA
jgi:hypothetical protein